MRKTLPIILFLVFALIAVAAGWLYVDGGRSLDDWLNRFRLQEVNVSGVNHTPHEDLYKLIPAKPYPYVWSVPAGRLQKKLDHLPWIASSKVEKSYFPPALTIEIEEEEPLLVVDIGNHSWLVSRSGVLLQPLEVIEDGDLVVEASSLPRLTGLGLRKGKSEDEVFRDVIRLISEIDAFGGVPFVVEQYEVIEGDGVKIIPSDELNIPSVLIASADASDTEEKVKALGKVFADLRHRGEKALSLDLRFSGQVVVKKSGDAPLP